MSHRKAPTSQFLDFHTPSTFSFFHFRHPFYGHPGPLCLLKHTNLFKNFKQKTLSYYSFLCIQFMDVGNSIQPHSSSTWGYLILSSHHFLIHQSPPVFTSHLVQQIPLSSTQGPFVNTFNSQWPLSLNWTHRTKLQSMYNVTLLQTYSLFTPKQESVSNHRNHMIRQLISLSSL